MKGPAELLLTLTASGSALGLMLMLLRRMTGRRLPSAFWYYAWLPVLLRLVLPLPGLIPAAERAYTQPETQAEQRGPAPARRSYKDLTETEPFVFAASSEEERPADVQAEAGGTPAEPPAPMPADQTDLWAKAKELIASPGFWMGLWLLGAVICLLRYGWGYFRFCRALFPTLDTVDGRTARIYAALSGGRGPRLFRSPYVNAPMLLGVLRPLIILPDEPLSPETAQNVLRHELTHYNRGDLIYKWFAAIVTSLHWFNPLTGVFRREIDRTCELSCDERLLRRMDRGEKQSYGETLLELAARQSPPRGVPVTTFATEKRDLKERLEQIMKYKLPKKRVIALAIAAMSLLSGCAAALAPAAETASLPEPRIAALSAAADTAPAPTPEPADPPEEAAPDGVVTYAEKPASRGETTVTNADELLEAIAPDTVIHLAAGTYDLAEAESYGAAIVNGWYSWEKTHDGYELVVTGVENLTIAGESPENTLISARPRYADVVSFRDCQGLTLSGFTAGHTEAPGICSGGVIDLESTDDVRLENCDLYGCGILAVSAKNCRSVTVADSVLRECSNGAVEAVSCWDVRLERCDIRACGEESCPAAALLNVRNCWGFAVTDCEMTGSDCSQLLAAQYSREVYLLGTSILDNTVRWCVFELTGCEPVVEGCRFRFSAGDPAFGGWYGGEDRAVSPDGRTLEDVDLSGMSLAHVDHTGPAAMPAPELETRTENGLTYVTVTNVDELLAAIDSDTVVELAAGVYDLSSAEFYGAYGGDHCYWLGGYDGPGLIITDVENFQIVGAGREVTSLLATPRGANVLTFESCRNVAVTGLELGHTPGADQCGGSVLAFSSTDTALVRECGLFGCGRVGVLGRSSANVTVQDCEIYDCSFVPAELRFCSGFDFQSCSIHDCGSDDMILEFCADITLDGTELAAAESAKALPQDASGEASAPEEVVIPAYAWIIDEDSALSSVMGVPGQQFRLRLEVSPPDAAYMDVLWESSDETVASVDQSGLVTLLEPGECRIAVTLLGQSKLTAECEAICISDAP